MTLSGEKLPFEKTRSYNISQSLNGIAFKSGMSSLDNMPHFEKTTQITQPVPTSLLVFMEVHEDSIFDALFGNPDYENWGDRRRWWDIPANRHNQGANFSFADGHVERHHWVYPKVVRTFLSEQSVPDAELPDYRWIQNGMKQYNNQ
jgi:prepilin-type processing-associated H-X9-DG protein